MTTPGKDRAWASSAARFFRVQGAALAVALGAVFAMAAASSVEAANATIQLPATTFIQQCPCTAGIGSASVRNGVLTPDGPSTYYAPLPFTGIKKVCGLTAYYRDVNNDQRMRVRIFSRATGVGGSVDDPATLMAEVESGPGVADSIRKVSTSNVVGGTLKPAQRFYYVQVDFDNINMDLVGVQVEMRDTCS